jgi:hypothetical protein
MGIAELKPKNQEIFSCVVRQFTSTAALLTAERGNRGREYRGNQVGRLDRMRSSSGDVSPETVVAWPEEKSDTLLAMPSRGEQSSPAPCA